MTNEEAIKYLQQLYPNAGNCWLDEQRIEAIGMAIKSLQEEPISEDLEQAADRYGEQHITYKDDDGYWIDTQGPTADAFKAGAQWQREQMKETLQMEYEKGRYDMREELMHDDKFLKAIGHTYVEWIDAGINTNDVDPADYIREHLFD